MDDTEADTGEYDLPAALLPRLTQLSSLLSRGRVAERAMESTGLTLERPALTLLSVLNMAGRPLRVGEIADRMQVVGPHVTRLINTLEQRGLVRRVTDPSDQRARLIEPTLEGASAIGRYLQAVFEWFTAAMSDWPQQDRRDLGRLLARLVDDLTAHTAAIEGTDSSH